MGAITPSTNREATVRSKSDVNGADESSLLQGKNNNVHHSATTSTTPPDYKNKHHQNDNSEQKRKTKKACLLSAHQPIVLQSPSPPSLTTRSLSSLQYHIYVLYAVTVCLILLCMSAGVFCYFQLSALKRDLSQHKVVVSQLVLDLHPMSHHSDSSASVFMPYQFRSDSSKFQRSWDTGMVFKGEGASLGDDSTRKRSKRQAVPSGKNDKDKKKAEFEGDWMWMSSYTRVPMTALKSYCKEAQTYCAASGKPGPRGEQGYPGESGPVGSPGDKGEPGDPGYQGEKGDKGSEGERGSPGKRGPGGGAQNMALGGQGPPGPKGDSGQKGERGSQGRPGRKGDRGNAGIPGQDGMDGTQGPIGPRGPKGERGMRGVEGIEGPKGDRGYQGPEGERGISGTPGVPGMKGRSGRSGPMGPPGRRGEMGQKGQAGYCKIQCVDTGKPTTAYPEIETTQTPKAFPPRKKECSIRQIGKPVYLRNEPRKQGAFMIDSSPVDDSKGKVWMTYGLTGLQVYEFANMAAFTRNRSSKVLDLNDVPFFGTGSIVYKGCMYYHQANTPFIVRYNLTIGQSTTVRELINAIYRPDSAKQGYLYQSKNTFFDFNADSNGLWVVYGNKNTMKLMVALLELRDLDVLNAVQLDISQGSKGNAFIACGKLYTLDYYNRSKAKVDMEYDLWTGMSKAQRLPFGNPFRSNRMLKFDGRQKKIFTWDASIQLSVPLLVKSN